MPVIYKPPASEVSRRARANSTCHQWRKTSIVTPASSSLTMGRRLSLPASLPNAAVGEEQPSAQTDDARMKSYSKYLGQVEAFAELPAEKRLDAARVLRCATHAQDETIVKQSDSGDRFHIVIEGTVSVIQDGVEIKRIVASGKKPYFFGENALLGEDVQAATIKVVSETATTLSMGKSSFAVLLRPTLVGPRRVAAAMKRRLLEDARERHLSRESYKTRVAEGCSNKDYASVMFVEAVYDIVPAVKKSLASRRLAEGFKESAGVVGERRQRLKLLMDKFRRHARSIGEICVIGKHVRALEGIENVWKDLFDSLPSPTASSRLAASVMDSCKELSDSGNSVLASKIKAIFRKYDINGDGLFSKAELSCILEKFGTSCANLDHVFAQIDTDNDGAVSYDEFVDWLMVSSESAKDLEPPSQKT